jgi:hypothetical protein
MSHHYHCRCGAKSDPFATKAERDQMLEIHERFCTNRAPAPNSREAREKVTKAGLRGRIRARKLV